MAGEPKYKSRVDAVREGYVEIPRDATRESSEDVATQTPHLGNPYFRALVVLTIVSAAVSVVGWIVAGVAGAGYDFLTASVATVIATFSFYIGFVLFVATLITGAVTWQLRKQNT